MSSQRPELCCSVPQAGAQRTLSAAGGWNEPLWCLGFMGRKRESPGPLQAPGEWRGVFWV